MKTIDYLRISFTVFVLFLLASILNSCNEDEGGKKIVVNQVFLQSAENPTQVIEEARVGTLIRLDGSGFSSLRAIYCNGTKVTVNPNLITEHSVIFSIPAEDIALGIEADEAVRNTIRLVSKFDDYVHPFSILDALPSIARISHTLPKADETIEIYGTKLKELESIVFPNGTTLSPDMFETNSDFTKVTLKVPSDAMDTPGAILVLGTNGAAYSYNDMFCANCVVISNFSFGPVYAGSIPGHLGGLTGNQTAEIPTGGDPSQPAIYRAVPNVIPSTTTLQAIDGPAFTFNFSPKGAAELVIANSGGLITGATNCNTLALQMDIFIPVEWTSGYFRVNFKPGTDSYSGNAAPSWAAGGGNVSAVTMTGWQTVTIPLASIPSVASLSMQGVISTLTDNGNIQFYNEDYTDAKGDTYTANEIENFQVFFGNARIVPYVKPALPVEDE